MFSGHLALQDQVGSPQVIVWVVEQQPENLGGQAERRVGHDPERFFR